MVCDVEALVPADKTYPVGLQIENNVEEFTIGINSVLLWWVGVIIHFSGTEDMEDSTFEVVCLFCIFRFGVADLVNDNHNIIILYYTIYIILEIFSFFVQIVDCHVPSLWHDN